MRIKKSNFRIVVITIFFLILEKETFSQKVIRDSMRVTIDETVNTSFDNPHVLKDTIPNTDYIVLKDTIQKYFFLYDTNKQIFRYRWAEGNLPRYTVKEVTDSLLILTMHGTLPIAKNFAGAVAPVFDLTFVRGHERIDTARFSKDMPKYRKKQIKKVKEEAKAMLKSQTISRNILDKLVVSILSDDIQSFYLFKEFKEVFKIKEAKRTDISFLGYLELMGLLYISAKPDMVLKVYSQEIRNAHNQEREANN